MTPPANETSAAPATATAGGAMFSLQGQTAIVTGAATGIGKAIATRLAAAGATIAVFDLNLAEAQGVAATLPNGSFAVEADVSKSGASTCWSTMRGYPVPRPMPGNRPMKTGTGISRLI
jgi:hypothetical protein